MLKIAREQKHSLDIVAILMDSAMRYCQTGKIQIGLLVAKEELVLNDNEYYDLHCRLQSERKDGNYQMYIYANNEGNISQKAMIYADEQLRFVKRQPSYLNYYGGATIGLIEMIDDLIIENIDKEIGNIYWDLFEKMLIANNKKKTSNVSVPSNASKASMGDLCERVLTAVQKTKEKEKQKTNVAAPSNATRK